MKKIFVFCLFSLVYSLLAAQTVTINEKGAFINDVNVSEDWSLSDFKNVLGEADHATSGVGMANRVYYYENKGIIFWEPMKDKSPTEKVTEIQIFFVQLTEAVANYKTKEAFSGKVSIDNLNLTKYISAGRLKNALKTWTPKECYFQHGYKYSNGIVAINFGFNVAETELLWILIDPAK